MKSITILASTIGWDIAEVSECRYQRYTLPSVYSIGDLYFAVSKRRPKHEDVGGEWKPHPDQFWAEQNGTTVWVCGDARTGDQRK